jgi:hypothetical protein
MQLPSHSHANMTGRIAVSGTPGYVRGSSFMDTNELLSSVGANTGNLVFQYAVTNSLGEQPVFLGRGIPWDARAIREACRVLVIPSANFIREGFDISGFVQFIEQTNLPLVVLGLGAQAESYEKRAFQLHPSITRLLALCRERCKTIGVRGAFTAEVLECFGVKNVEIIGCPSNFLNSDDDLPDKLAAKWQEETAFVCTTGDEPWPKSPAKRDAERNLIQLTRDHGGIYIQQSVEPFVRILRRANPYQRESVEPALINSLRQALAPDMNISDFCQFLSSSVRIYYAVDQWLEDSARFNFSIGLRLHGNMVAFQSGCPAVWIYHDARTRELAETMALPCMTLESFNATAPSLAEIKKRVDFDMAAYRARRVQLLARYKRILGEAGVGRGD